MPALHALVAAPAVGSVVLLFVGVGLIAMAVGAFSGGARRNGVMKRDRKAPRQDTTVVVDTL